MNPLTPVSDIMIKNIIGLTMSDNIESIEALFKRHKIKHLPVVSGGVIIGMVSYTDIMRISKSELVNGSKNADTVVRKTYSVEQVMSKEITSITSDATIKEATRILSKREFHALPVVDNGELVGIITTRDLLKYFLKQI
jgi:CBS domain-containing membrane protein